MVTTHRARRALAGSALFILSSVASAAGVRMDFDDPSTAPFPSNRYTVFDGSQITLRRVNLPKPDCAVRVTDCQDITVLNTLDGFSTQPRITVPFDGDIDPASVTSQTVFLLNLGDTLTLRGAGERVGINQVLWDPTTRTLVFTSDQLLQQHSRYLVVVTDGVRDAGGKKIKSNGNGEEFGIANGRDAAGAEYRGELRDALRSVPASHGKIVAGTVFTTQSATTDLAKIKDQIKRSTPAPVNFEIGVAGGGGVRAVFPTASLTAIQFQRQTGAAVFTNSFLPTPALNIVPGAVGQVAYGMYASPNYLTPAQYIPATPTLAGAPQQQGTNQLVVQFFLPAGPKPAGGWPVALFGHGFTDSMYGAPWVVASVLASRGIATAAINVVGHGGGALGRLNVLRTVGVSPVVVPAGGRGFDQDGDGTIASTEGSSAAPPFAIASSRDALRQTTVDLMQLVRVIETGGVDVDGDGSSDLNPGGIYYAGQSFGGIYGTILLGTEPSIRAGVPNVPGGSIIDIVRLSPAFRPLGGIALAGRVPSLINVSGIDFNENIPLRNQPPVVNTVAGAMDIQRVFDWQQWVQQPGNPVSYAAQIRKQPLPGAAPKPVIIQFAKGDMTVPNPTSSAIVRAGDLADRATYFRNDLANAANNTVPKNPHTFLTNVSIPAAAPYAIGAQTQMAVFFQTGGGMTIDPDAGAPFFEVPIQGPLPEGLNFIP